LFIRLINVNEQRLKGTKIKRFLV